MDGRRLLSSALCAMAAFSWCNVHARDKKDVVHFVNGDRLTCEIVNLDRGYLYVKLDYGDGTMSLNWLSVAKIESPQLFLVTDEFGRQMSGTFSTALETEAKTPEFIVTGTGGKVTIQRAAIVRLDQRDRDFWRDLEGSISGGTQWNQSNQQVQSNLSASATYRTTKWTALTSYTGSFSGSLQDASDLRNEVQLAWEHVLRRENYYIGTFADFLQSQPQQLKLRSVYGAGLVRYAKNTNRTRIRLLGGAAWTRENYSAPDDAGQTRFNSAEIVLGSSIEFFRFKAFRFGADLSGYPSVSDLGRFRFDTNTTMRWEILTNLFWSVNVYSNYDSRPPRNTQKTDSGVSSNIGWTF